MHIRCTHNLYYNNVVCNIICLRDRIVNTVLIIINCYYFNIVLAYYIYYVYKIIDVWEVCTGNGILLCFRFHYFYFFSFSPHVPATHPPIPHIPVMRNDIKSARPIRLFCSRRMICAVSARISWQSRESEWKICIWWFSAVTIIMFSWFAVVDTSSV